MYSTETTLRKQSAVIEDLFSSPLSEKRILEKHNINRETLDKWMSGKEFSKEFADIIKRLRCRTTILIAKYSSEAVKRLIELTESEKQETARKACLDILGLQAEQASTEKNDTEENPRPKIKLSPEKASKLLKLLAEK
jgi:hypothetical protein